MSTSAGPERPCDLSQGADLGIRYDDVSRWASTAAHTDISFENVPSDYSMLKINTLPETGGDTIWWNTYDILEKMSPSMQQYLGTLEAEHSAEFFHDEARRLGIKIRPERERGHPLNKGDHLTAIHPVVRTSESKPPTVLPSGARGSQEA